jgi:hypothetical protein
VFTFKGAFLDRIVPQGKASLEFILKALKAAPEVARPATEEHVKLAKGNYRRLVTLDDRFVYALDKAGIEEILSETTRAPNGRRVMVYRFKNPERRASA